MKHTLRPFKKFVVLAASIATALAAHTARAEIAIEDLLNPDDATDVWGRKITGLGDNGDETALVFTKTGTTMNMTLPDGVSTIWYLVVGGGGSGGTSYADGNSGGGGGGAGGMVEAKDVSLSSSAITVQVGEGGAAVTATNNGSSRPAGNTGDNSTLTLNGDAVVAHGGGGGGGCVSKAGKTGGSGGGAYANNTVGTCYAGEGNVGGHGTGSKYGGGGGGGAGSAGGNTTSSAGGAGGDGKTSEIGGGYVSLVKYEGKDIYCAGGGGGGGKANGGDGGVGGGGKGNVYVSTKTATTSDSGNNYGCGGGGTQGNLWANHTSGAGYQGVVIVRYRKLAANVVAVPVLESKVYTGENQVADVPENDGYTVTANEGGVNAGDYPVTLTLVSGYQWDGGSTEPTNITFTITKAENEWVVDPSIVPASWEFGDAPGTVDKGETRSDAEAVVTYDDELTVMPVTVGSHTAHFTVPEGKNHLAITTPMDVTYTVTHKTIADANDPTKKLGYQVAGLGADGDEVALVFTNTAGTLAWTAPTTMENVRLLAVGGAGGGGGGTFGPGGGGGGVVTGVVHQLAKNVTYAIKVGAGGSGGTYNGATGTKGGDTSLVLDETTYAIAYGGGAGRNKADGGDGGSGSGGGANTDTLRSGGAATKGDFDSTLVSGECFGNAGGNNASNGNASGGGGGATEAGGDAWVNSIAGGKGGEGLVSDITGVSRTYGSGGGGGGNTSVTEAASGAGQGAKNYTYATSGTDTLGGGGGGGGQNDSAHLPGGKGGSGILVLRYTKVAGVAIVPTIASKVYTGETLVADVSDGEGYTVTANEGGTDVGNYPVTLTLSAGYKWDDDTTEAKNLTFTITQAQNEWTVEPSVTKETWLTSDEPGVLTNGVTKFGTVAMTIAKDGGASEPFGGTLPTAAGDYVITYTAPATCDNYLAPEVTEKSVSFQIVDASVVPPFTVAIDGAITVGEADGVVTAAVPYRVSCDVESPKTVTVYALYAEEGSDVTNQVALAENVALDGAGFGFLNDLKPNATYAVALYGQGGATVAPTSNWVSVKMLGAARDLSASATFTNDPKEFILSGSVTPGLGTTTVYLRWSLNSEALDQSAAYTFNYGDAGMFSTNIVYTDLWDKLTWDVAVSNTYASATYGEQQWNDAIAAFTKTRADTAAVTYTWTGAGDDNSWLNPTNWSANVTSCFGYPDNATYATAKFTQAASVNLAGAKIDLAQNGLQFAENIAGDVVISNGTVAAAYKADRERGASGTTVVFSDATFDVGRLGPVAGSTFVFAGNSSIKGAVRPWGDQVTQQKLVFRDGEISVGWFEGYCNAANNGDDLLISNAVVTATDANNGGKHTSGRPYRFIDGDEREARFVATGANAKLALADTYEVTLPEGGRVSPVLQAPACADDSKSYAFRIDVTNWQRGKKVPLVKFTAADQSAEMAKKAVTVTAYAGGVDETEKRNARLEWSAEDNTLYYRQDGQIGLIMFVR